MLLPSSWSFKAKNPTLTLPRIQGPKVLFYYLQNLYKTKADVSTVIFKLIPCSYLREKDGVSKDGPPSEGYPSKFGYDGSRGKDIEKK